MNLVITGGTKGIGRAAIELFASKGFNIITCSRHEDELNYLEEIMHSKYPSIEIHTMVCDMGDKTSVLGFADFIHAKFSTIEVLVHNAGLFFPGTVETEADGTFETLMNLNIGGSYHLTRALIKKIKMTPGAHIFTMCSTASIKGYLNGGSYCISKFALLGMTKVLREELKNENVKVTAMISGAAYTDSWAGTHHPVERFMKAEDIAQSIYDCYNLKSGVVEEILIRPQLGDI